MDQYRIYEIDCNHFSDYKQLSFDNKINSDYIHKQRENFINLQLKSYPPGFKKIDGYESEIKEKNDNLLVMSNDIFHTDDEIKSPGIIEKKHTGTRQYKHVTDKNNENKLIRRKQEKINRKLDSINKDSDEMTGPNQPSELPKRNKYSKNLINQLIQRVVYEKQGTTNVCKELGIKLSTGETQLKLYRKKHGISKKIPPKISSEKKKEIISLLLKNENLYDDLAKQYNLEAVEKIVVLALVLGYCR